MQRFFCRTLTTLSCGMLLALITSASGPPSRSEELARPALPPSSQLSLIIHQVGHSKPRYQLRPDTLRLPASTLKLLTALAATLYLGPDFRFETQLRTVSAAVINSTLDGDLFIRFEGDPTLSTLHLEQLLGQAKDYGITRITGDLVLDVSAFSGYDRGSGWVWDDLGICYSAPVSTLALDQNCVKGRLYPGRQIGELANAVVPDSAYITVTSRVKTLAEATVAARYCKLEMMRFEKNRYELSGCTTPQDGAIPLAIAVTDPLTRAQAVLKRALPHYGIQLDGSIRIGLTPQQSQLLAHHQSSSLPELIQTMLKESNNLIADALLKTLGRLYFQPPGHFGNGTAALKTILKQQMGSDLTHSFLADGSGLSRYNLLTARQLLQILGYMQQHDPVLNLIKRLPIAGVDGTLEHRRSLQHPALRGQMRAKTGAMKHVSSLAGYLNTARGNVLMFVLLINGYHVDQTGEPPPTGPVPLTPLEQFEQALFTALYHEDFAFVRQMTLP